VIESWSSKEEIVAIVDCDKGYEPNHMLMRRRVQIVLASSLKGANQPWMKQTALVTVLATKLWSARELFLTGFVLGLLHSDFFRISLYAFDISLELLRESTLYFGYNPRLCFSAAHSVDSLEMKEEDVMSQIRDIAAGGSNISQLLHSFQRGDSDVSFSFCKISNRQTTAPHTMQVWRCLAMGFDQLLKQCKTRRADAAAGFY